MLTGSSQLGLGELPRVDEVIADLRARIDRITGRSAAVLEGDEDLDPLQAFVDFDEFDNPTSGQRGPVTVRWEARRSELGEIVLRHSMELCRGGLDRAGPPLRIEPLLGGGGARPWGPASWR